MSVTNKEKNFISAVVYLHNDGAQAVRFFKALNAVLDQHFEQYELVAVDDACADDTIPTLRDWAKALEKPLTILHLSLHQGRETAMNAGLDAAIGDYVYEFDSTQTPYPIELVFEAYRAAMAGSDIVSVCPRSTAGSSKAAYAASGLKMTDLEFDGRLTDNSGGRFALAMDSLALYTDAGYKLSAGIAIVMMFLALAELAYTLIIFCAGHPIEGWTTMMFVLTLGFAGLFAVLTIIIKYLSLLVDLVFKKQNYLIESIEKIQK